MIKFIKFIIIAFIIMYYNIWNNLNIIDVSFKLSKWIMKIIFSKSSNYLIIMKIEKKK